uniref:ISXO2-like transposase domain-containing protein n=1 Tax=Octopus bimaculoides TaxID=37653 RepID=A0A0L8GWY5_OCTBM
MPRGRPAAQQLIVPENEILTRELILEEYWNITELCSNSRHRMLEWCARRRLIRNKFTCDDCLVPCGLVARGDRIDGKEWYCKNCKQRKSVRYSSFFERSHIPLYNLVLLIYCWCKDIMQKHIVDECSVCHTSVVDWSNFCREVCDEWLRQNSVEIGGVDSKGQPLVVEIEESKFFHRKYHQVLDRTERTLSELIQRWILPGTHIISDGWASYANTGNLGGCTYTHEVIVHGDHFVEPNDNGIHTQNIENLWMRLKRKLRWQFRTSDELFSSCVIYL